MARSRFPRSAAAAATLSAVAVFGLRGQALAATIVETARTNTVSASAIPFHAALLKAEPGKSDTVTTSPKTIKLWFSESVQLAVTTIRVAGPAAHSVVLGKATMDSAPKSPVVFPVTETLKAGKYTVSWKAMATDGHPSNGMFMFVVRDANTKPAK